MSELELSGFVNRDYSWHINTGQISKMSCFRLKDNYMRFYLKNITFFILGINNLTYL